MREQVVVTKQVSASPEAIWNIVKDPSGWEKWFSLIQHSSVEGTGEGAKRVCHTPQGTLNETIETIDENQKIFQYRIYKQDMMPIQDVLGTVQVIKSDADETLVHWKADFEALDLAKVDSVKQMMQRLYLQAIDGLNEYANQLSS